jgi:hypothetical protein
MLKLRVAMRTWIAAGLFLPVSAFAANYEVKAYIDTDNSRRSSVAQTTAVQIRFLKSRFS